MHNVYDSHYTKGKSRGTMNQLELEKTISYMLPLKKIHSVRSSIILNKRKSCYGKIGTDFLDRSMPKADLLRCELNTNDVEMAKNAVLGINDEELSSRDDKMSDISDNQGKNEASDVNMVSDVENNETE